MNRRFWVWLAIAALLIVSGSAWAQPAKDKGAAAFRPRDYTAHLIGHAHIDLSWLWRWEETVNDIADKTFRGTLAQMDKMPGLTFAQSQAALYDAVEKDYPDLFRRSGKRSRTGPGCPVGGMWVEPDLNMPDGEALARQLLYGKRYFLDKFGVDVTVGWNPDTFGHNWQLPQILSKAGINYYVFGRCAPKDTNIFGWEGMDGSQVLGYAPPGLVQRRPQERRQRPDPGGGQDHEPQGLHGPLRRGRPRRRAARRRPRGDLEIPRRQDAAAARVRPARALFQDGGGPEELPAGRQAGAEFHLPGLLHDPGRDQEEQPPAGEPPADGREVLGPGRDFRIPGLLSRARPRRGLEDRPPQPVPRHPRRLEHRPGLRRGRRVLPGGPGARPAGPRFLARDDRQRDRHARRGAAPRRLQSAGLGPDRSGRRRVSSRPTPDGRSADRR